MEYTLMHKRVAVADIEIDTDFVTITGIREVFLPDHLPAIGRVALTNWLHGRSIPASRQGLQTLLEQTHKSRPAELLLESFALSLSDHYWIKPRRLDTRWDDINFFDNQFSEDVGDILFGSQTESQAISLLSPDNTSDGWLKKKWKIIDGKRCLIKGGSLPYRQEPLNEVIASKVCTVLGLKAAEYSIQVIDGVPHSVCEDFVSTDSELISAWYIFQMRKQDNAESHYQHYLRVCEELGIPGMQEFLDKMFVLDFLMMNEDRHLGNFGALRDPETLQWIGPAPVYDTGTSLCYNRDTGAVSPYEDVPCKPFSGQHEKQIGLVSSFDFINFSELYTLCQTLSGMGGYEPHRLERILYALRGRVDMLYQLVK